MEKKEIDKVEEFRNIALSLSDLYKQKNTAYGDSFGRSIDRYGKIAGLTRISDKFNRLEQLILHPNTNVGDERVIDTLDDMASYCIMLKIEYIKNQSNEKK